MHIQSSDGLRLEYDIQGRGPGLLLVHGFGADRHTWDGVTDQLAAHFTVIRPDLRGCGNSDKPLEVAAYHRERHLDDLMRLADAVGAHTFHYWGFSFGATIGIHLGATCDRVARAVVSGSYFGHIFTPARIQGYLDDPPPTDVERYNARINAMASYPGIEPSDIRCPMLVTTGTRDGSVVGALMEQRDAIEAAGLQLHIFDDLNHAGLVSPVVLPTVLAFLWYDQGEGDRSRG